MKLRYRNLKGFPEQGSIGSEFMHSRWGHAHLVRFDFMKPFGKANERRKQLQEIATRIVDCVEVNTISRMAAPDGLAPRPFVVVSQDLPLPPGIKNNNPESTCFGVVLMPKAARTKCDHVGLEIVRQQKRIIKGDKCTIHSVMCIEEGGIMVAAMLRAMSNDLADVAVAPPKSRLVSAYHDDDLMVSYDNWVRRLLEGDGTEAIFLTYMFSRLSGNANAVRDQMWKEITYFYGRLLIRTHNRPGRTSAQAHHPRLIAAPDFPVLKKAGVKCGMDDVSINGGLHYHGILLMPALTRLSRGVDTDIRLDQTHYVGHHGLLKRIHAVAVTDTHRDLVGYALKDVWNSMFRQQSSGDDILLLPKSRSELTPRAEMRHSRRLRESG